MDFEVWNAWTEPSLGRAHPDSLVMGTYKGIETLIWLEVEAGKKFEKEVVADLMGRYKQARAFAEERKVNLIFAVLSLPWVLKALENYGLFLIPGSMALLFDTWRHRGYLPVPIVGGFNSLGNDYEYIKNLSQIIKKNPDVFLPKLLPARDGVTLQALLNKPPTAPESSVGLLDASFCMRYFQNSHFRF